MDRDLCKRNALMCHHWARMAADEDTREAYVRYAQTWDGLASQFIDRDIEAPGDD